MTSRLEGRLAFYKIYFQSGRGYGPRTLWVRCVIQKVDWEGGNSPENTPVTVVGVDDDKGITYVKKLKELIIADE